MDRVGKDKNQMQQEWEQERRELRQALKRALEGDEQKPLRDWLEKTARSASYQPGRDLYAVTWAEGKRAIATFILNEGGYSNE